MKKILLFLFIVILPELVFGQWTGDGLTSSTAYFGKINSANPMADWTIGNYPGGVVYVGRLSINENDLEIENSGSLTIGPGITIKFCTTESDLRITGSGVLSAIGNTLNPITFTKNTQVSWGHISFEGSVGYSTMNYCIVEYGSKTGSGIEGYGGGIHIYTSNLTISNCIIRFYYATWGGGIFISQFCDPTIDKTIIHSNVASEGGGGLYIWLGSSSLVTNCIIYNNNCTGTTLGGGGIFIGYDAALVKIINCVIAKNTATNVGDGIYFSQSANSKIINSIIWGSNTQIYFYNNPTSSLQNCGIQGVSYSTCLNLNSDNNQPDGPNFVDPTNSNYSITFASPCRDAGTTPSPAVPNDFIGNPRVGPYDIGAYEIQFNNLWTGTISTDWFTPGNWATNNVPGHASYVIIDPSNHDPVITTYPVSIISLSIESNSALTVADRQILTSSIVQNSGTLTVTNAATLNAPSFINTGTFVVDPTGKATVNSLTNNGTINLNSDNVDMFSFMFDTYSGTGTTNIAMFVSGGGGPAWNWHYVAVPADYINDKTMFTSINPYDLMQYDDSQIPNTLVATDNDGWVWHDGYVVGPPPSMDGPGFSDLIVGRGYGFYHPSTSGAYVNFKSLSSLVASLGSLPLQYHGDGKLVPTNYGFNLLGNSLTCGIDWDKVTTSGNMSTSVYYTINYKIGSYVQGGVGINGATKDIPPLQGFLVRAYASGASVNFSNSREHTTQVRYKRSLDVNNLDSKNSGSSDPVIKLELDNPTNQDETAIWFNQNATKSFDAAYDGLKLLSSGYDQIYSWSGTQKFGINAMPLPTDIEIIPIAVKFLNGGTGIKIVASQLVGLDNYNVTLTDKTNSNFTVDLKKTASYTFSSDAGTFPDRFVLTVGTIATAVPDVIIPDRAFNVFVFDKTLNIDLLNDEWDGKTGDVNIFDLTGRKILQQTNVEWYKGTLTKIPLNVQQGIYIVEIKAENKKFITKINIIK